MASFTKNMNENFDDLLNRLQEGILNGSMSATLEEAWDTKGEHSRCSVRVFERYAWSGNNRVSLTITLFQEEGGPVQLWAATAGGSRAMFFKIDTIGEENFLEKLEQML